MTSEANRIADQLRRAFSGDAWHGSPLSELVAGIDAAQARARPLENAHSIWEIVLHIDAYVRVALEAAQGAAMPEIFGTDEDWPAAANDSAAWPVATDRMLQRSEELARAIEDCCDSRLQEKAPGSEYDFYLLFHGIVQHSLYHGGQIALLKKALLAK